MKKGIDISYHNPLFTKLNSYNDFVMVRCGYRGYGDGSLNIDKKFYENVKICEAQNTPYGVYFFSQALNANEGEAEAKFVINAVKDLRPTYPIVIDSELSGAYAKSGRADKISVGDRTLAVKAFCKCLEDNGYYAMIYCSSSWRENNLNYDELREYDWWVADWRGVQPTNCGMWQTGINYFTEHNVSLDVDIAYKDYPKIITAKGLNNSNVKVRKLHSLEIKMLSDGDLTTVQKLADSLILDYEVKEIK